MKYKKSRAGLSLTAISVLVLMGVFSPSFAAKQGHLERSAFEPTEMFGEFRRLSNNPILKPRKDRFDSAGAFNPSVVKNKDGKFVMLYRGQDNAGVSRIGYAISADGVKFEADEHPILAPKLIDEEKGIEDPRLSPSLVEVGKWDLTATAYNTDAQLVLYRSSDLRNWDRVSTMMPAKKGAWNINWTKSGAIVPEKINGKYWAYYMGDDVDGHDQMGVISSVDGANWIDETKKPILKRRPGQFDSRVVEPGPAPIITKDGILLLYNGADDGLTYKTGWALFDKSDPTKVLARCQKPIFVPDLKWEKKIASKVVHQAPNVVFVEGLVKDGERYLVYYGAADSYVGVAETHL